MVLGTVYADDMTEIFEELGVRLSDEELNNLKLQFDVDSNGKFGYVEFLRAAKPVKGVSADLWQVKLHSCFGTLNLKISVSNHFNIFVFYSVIV